ncbi:MAG: hypothetical protein OQL16_06530 [Gammaproteobacteria bacterium]|nr:hypothetical protein [Gammaproteobacteria bacterium]
MNTDLSLEQAPPISVPFQFFVTAPLFGIVASIILLAYGPAIFTSRWNLETLAVTHLLTLGFMGLVMCGAILQMLPVLSGITVPYVKPVGTLIHILLVTGIIALSIGFLASSPVLMNTAIGLLGGGFGIFIVVILMAMLRNKMTTQTLSAMRLALISLLFTVILGISLLGSFIWPDININLALLTELHIAWGTLGWVSLLLIGVAFQVVPMFQMTNEYPRWMTRFLPSVLFGGLVVWTIIKLSGIGNPWHIAAFIMLICISGYVSFAIITLWLQQSRKRKLRDTTLLFWRFAMLSALAAAALWADHNLMPGLINPEIYPFTLGIVLLAGFAVSVMNGMLYKIMPFLIWFHLQHHQLSLGLGRKYAIPNMKQIIPDQNARYQLYLHIIGILTLVLASLFPTSWLVYPAGVMLMTSFSMLSFNQLRAVRLYRDYKRRLQAASEATSQTD